MDTHTTLTAANFLDLISGRKVEVSFYDPPLVLCLEDIGFNVMRRLIDVAAMQVDDAARPDDPAHDHDPQDVDDVPWTEGDADADKPNDPTAKTVTDEVADQPAASEWTLQMYNPISRQWIALRRFPNRLALDGHLDRLDPQRGYERLRAIPPSGKPITVAARGQSLPLDKDPLTGEVPL